MSPRFSVMPHWVQADVMAWHVREWHRSPSSARNLTWIRRGCLSHELQARDLSWASRTPCLNSAAASVLNHKAQRPKLSDLDICVWSFHGGASVSSRIAYAARNARFRPCSKLSLYFLLIRRRVPKFHSRSALRRRYSFSPSPKEGAER